MKKIASLSLSCLALQAAFGQFSSGTPTLPNTYTNATLNGTISDLDYVVFVNPKIGKVTFGSGCDHLIFNNIQAPVNPDGSLPPAWFSFAGSNSVIQFGIMASSNQVAMQVTGKNNAVIKLTFPALAGRAINVGGNGNQVLDCLIPHACQVFNHDTGAIYLGNSLGTEGGHLIKGNTVHCDTATDTYLIYLDSHASYNRIEGNYLSLPCKAGVFVNGGAFNAVQGNYMNGTVGMVADRQWDTGVLEAVRYIIGDQFLWNGCPVKASSSLVLWGNTTPRRQFVTVK